MKMRFVHLCFCCIIFHPHSKSMQVKEGNVFTRAIIKAGAALAFIFILLTVNHMFNNGT